MARTPSSISAEVERAVGPLLAERGYELVWVEYVPRSRVLRLYVDHPQGVTVEDCTSVSHLVGDVLDAEGFSDRIDARYILEVSSPGLDRPLVKPGHFQRFVGQQARVTTSQPIGGRRKFHGFILAANESGIEMRVDGQTQALSYEQIASARLVPDL